MIRPARVTGHAAGTDLADTQVVEDPSLFAFPRSWARATLALIVPSLLIIAFSLVRAPQPAGQAAAVLNRSGLPTLASADGDRNGIPDDATDICLEPERRTARLGRGGTLAGALERLGLSGVEANRVARALAAELDLRRLPSATGLRATLDFDGSVRSLAVRAEPGRFLRVSLAASNGPTTIESVALPTETRIQTAGGRIASSVHQALSGAEHAHELTLAFADVFQWDIDLFIEPREGDRVRLVYGVRVLAAVPGDLPPFGDAATRAGEFIELGSILAASYDGLIVDSTAFRIDDASGIGEYYDTEGRPLRKTFLKSPLNYRRISSRFSNARRHPITRKVVPHHGVDFAAAAGTPVVAAADGRVVAAGWNGALGRSVRIRHGSEYETIYGHLHGYAAGIRGGVEVRQGQLIGFVGSTGRATGPHLHYSLVQHGRAVDPMGLRNPPVEPLADALYPRLDRAVREWMPVLDGTASVVAGASVGGGVAAGLRRGA